MFPKCRGGEGVYNVLTFQKSRGARAHLGGEKAPPHLPLNETLQRALESLSPDNRINPTQY